MASTNAEGDADERDFLRNLVDETHSSSETEDLLTRGRDSGIIINALNNFHEFETSSSETDNPTNSEDQQGLVPTIQSLATDLTDTLILRRDASTQSTATEMSSSTTTTTDHSVDEQATWIDESCEHIMISYHHSCFSTCDRIRQDLENKNFVVWMSGVHLRGDTIDATAAAIQNSYVALICLNREYLNDTECNREAENLARKQIDLIPCLMETSCELPNWLEFILVSSRQIDFSSTNTTFEDKMNILIGEITHYEKQLMIYPRRRIVSINSFPMNTQSVARQEFDRVIRTFREWIEENQSLLRRTNRSEALKLAKTLAESLRADENFRNQSREEFLDNIAELIDHRRNTSNNNHQAMNVTAESLVGGVVYFLTIWALQKIYKQQ